MKRVIIATMLVSTGAMAQMSYDIEVPNQNSVFNRNPAILPVAPISRTGPTTVWQSGSYTYIEEPRGTTTVFQDGQFTYIRPPNGERQTMCQTIGQFSYCN